MYLVYLTQNKTLKTQLYKFDRDSRLFPTLEILEDYFPIAFIVNDKQTKVSFNTSSKDFLSPDVIALYELSLNTNFEIHKYITPDIYISANVILELKILANEIQTFNQSVADHFRDLKYFLNQNNALLRDLVNFNKEPRK
jgi:hypothetical protein